MKSKKTTLKSWKEFWFPFILCFAVTSVFFTILQPWNRFKKSPDIIILSPHFDDAILSLGGLISSQKNPALVATFFAGQPEKTLGEYWDKLSGFQNSDEALSRRTKENQKALAELGSRGENFPYLDFQYRAALNKTDEESLKKSIERDIEGVISRYGGKKISIYGPAEFGPIITHPDHKILHDAFVATASEKINQKNLRFFFYEDFPYAERYRQNQNLSLKELLSNANPGLTIMERHFNLEPAALSKKEAAISKYASQVEAFKNLGENILTESGLFSKNRCQKTEPSWTACEVTYEIEKNNNITSTERDK